MKYYRARHPALSGLITCLLALPAQASFHEMQIEQIIGGIDDTSSQAIQLRLRASGEGAVSQGKLVVYNSTGGGATVLVDFATDVSNEAQGDRILIATSSFVTRTEPNAVPDYTMSAIPSGYLAGGSLTFERDSGGVLWRVSWGTYSGSTTGENTNDSDANFGPKFSGALPSGSGNESALLFNGPANAASTNNAADYGVTAGAAVFTNNDGCAFTVDDSPNCGVADTDTDGTNDNCDSCTDSDGDEFGDPGFSDNCCPVDGCPNDALKTSPGVCGCGTPDTDSDGDGVLNCNDNCANTPVGEDANGEGCSCSQLDPSGDDDGDGVTNCDDGCPNDPDKTEAGPCGCNADDTDGDGDGTPDCSDDCPDDPNKIAPGIQGCGVAEADADGDLVPDPADNCPNDANAGQNDADGDGVGDACENGGGGAGNGCGATGNCAPMSSGLLPLFFLGYRAMRRRN